MAIYKMWDDEMNSGTARGVPATSPEDRNGDGIPDGAEVSLTAKWTKRGPGARAMDDGSAQRTASTPTVAPVAASAQMPRSRFAMMDRDPAAPAPTPGDWSTQQGLDASRNRFTEQRFLDDLLNSRDTRKQQLAGTYFGERRADEGAALERGSQERMAGMAAEGARARGDTLLEQARVQADARRYDSDRDFQASQARDAARLAEADKKLQAQEAKEKVRQQYRDERMKERQDARQATTAEQRQKLIMTVLDKQFGDQFAKKTLRGYITDTRNPDGTMKPGATQDPEMEDRLDDLNVMHQNWFGKPLLGSIPPSAAGESTPAGIPEVLVRIQAPDGKVYNVPRTRVDEFVQAGGKVL